METLKKIVSNQYFPAAAVLTAVVLFWTIAMFGGLSLLHNNQPPMATLTWMLFVYAAAVLTPLAGIIAAADLIRRWRRNRLYAQAEMAEYESAGYEPAEYETAQEKAAETEPAEDPQATPESSEQGVPETSREPVAAQTVQQRPATPQPAKKQQQAEPKQRKTAA